MTARPIALLLALTLAAAHPAGASPLAITPETQQDVMLTIYNGNFGLVKDVRETRLPAGDVEAQYRDVAAQIDPTTVHLRSLTAPDALRILEQNYEYDLLSSEKLLDKYVGRMVRLYLGDGTYHEARLLSTRGPIYEINGRIHLGSPGRLVLPSLPENLVARPTLVWLLRNRTTDPQRVEASYLTGGITWKADYVLVLDAADRRADVTGWVTLDNRSGATYRNAALKLVAGDVHRAPEPERLARMMDRAAKAASPAEARREFVSEGLFEYHLYTLDGRTTVKDNQTKQLALMAASGVSVDKRLFYHGAADFYRTSYGAPVANQKVAVVLELRNSAAQGLGAPLPRGKLRVYKADGSGSQQFVGEDWIDHTPSDERVRIKLGHAFDVVGERTQKEWRKLGAGLYEVEWEITLRNHKKEPEVVQIVDPVPGDWQVVHATHRWEKPQAHTLTFSVPVPAGGAAVVAYRVRLRF
jgi:hypothetical protein